MAARPADFVRKPVPIVLATTVLLKFVSAGRGAAMAFGEIGVAAFFAIGVVQGSLGSVAPWFILAAVLIGIGVRALDIESWSLFIPGGLIGRVELALGRRSARLVTATLLVERVLLASLAVVVVGHYIAVLVFPGLILPAVVPAFDSPILVDTPLVRTGASTLRRHLTAEGTSTLVALGLLGYLWLRQRMGKGSTGTAIAHRLQIALAIVVVLVLWGLLTVLWSTPPPSAWAALWPSIPLDPVSDAVAHQRGVLHWIRWLTGRPWGEAWASVPSVAIAVALALGLGHAGSAIGSGETLSRIAHELQPPRIRYIKRAALLVSLFTLLVTVGGSFLFVLLVPAADQGSWFSTPLIGIARQLAAPAWLGDALAIATVVGATLLLGTATRAALADAEGILLRLSHEGLLDERFRRPHPRFGTPSRLSDAVAASAALAILFSNGRIAWLAHAYAAGLLGCLVVRVLALIRLRTLKPGPRPFRVAFNLRFAGREWPLGLIALGVILAAPAAALVLSGDPPMVAGVGLIVGLTAIITVADRAAVSDRATAARTNADAAANAGRSPGRAALVDDVDTFQLLSAADVAVEQVEARPGGVLVTVRHPYFLAHLAAALQLPGDRDIVVMTARLIGLDVDEHTANDPSPTPDERRLFSQVVALAERYGRLVRLVIVPAHDVFDAIVATAVRLSVSDIYVGESATLAANDQARLVGEAWERAEKPKALAVRLVIHHRSGRTDPYHLGAHAPTLMAADLDLIHRLWLDASQAVGPHVHHHDVVRAALNQMAQHLEGPDRAAALDAIRDVARPADELAAAVRTGDFSRLRDMVRNRPAADLAALLTDLSLEDQVVVFRLLPRKMAAAAFEYLSHEAQETLLKAMAQEDVAALLNNMAPDDRTTFLEELPATATRQLLALLTPAERTVAMTLLGYPEGSIGRLMTPHYVAAREHWTVRQVLDHIRTHGQDSETLNVIYVVDEEGQLVDDVRIREFLLTSPDNRVTDLMDRHVVALKATDDEATAVAAFRAYDRVALPVTDTAGVLIGIVTIDDVLDVAEAVATKEIQKFGGSEALDEPYMKIAFGRMIQKRAGWLTALFFGEMLTATAMGSFEKELQHAVVLAFFVPLIISSGGNSGSQASTLVIRALALGELALKDWWQVMRRELGSGLALGAILGSIGFLRIAVWSAFSDIYTQHWPLVALTVALSLVGIVLWGTLVGSLLPFLLRRLGFDPATSSAPFVATLVDVTGLVIYFSVAMVVLRGTLL